MTILTDELIAAVVERMHLPQVGPHGLLHWARVYENGMQVAAMMPGVNTQAVQLFALFHDAGRENENRDPCHGSRGAQLAEELWVAGLIEATEETMRQLCSACSLHTGTVFHYDETVLACFDADRLDLPRVGVDIDLGQLCTKRGRELAGWASGNARRNWLPTNNPLSNWLLNS